MRALQKDTSPPKPVAAYEPQYNPWDDVVVPRARQRRLANLHHVALHTGSDGSQNAAPTQVSVPYPALPTTPSCVALTRGVFGQRGLRGSMLSQQSPRGRATQVTEEVRDSRDGRLLALLAAQEEKRKEGLVLDMAATAKVAGGPSLLDNPRWHAETQRLRRSSASRAEGEDGAARPLQPQDSSHELVLGPAARRQRRHIPSAFVPQFSHKLTKWARAAIPIVADTGKSHFGGAKAPLLDVVRFAHLHAGWQVCAHSACGWVCDVWVWGTHTKRVCALAAHSRAPQAAHGGRQQGATV